MAEVRLQFKPGIDTISSETASRGGWSNGNLMRWRSGWPEKLGGWKRLSNEKFTGICRTLHWWTDLLGLDWLALGTESQLALIQSGARHDITPEGLLPGLASSRKGSPYTLRVWSLDNFGENLLAVPSGGALYAWVPKDKIADDGTASAGLPGPATRVVAAPLVNQGMLVSMPQQIVVAYGSSPFGGNDKGDPLLLRWCDQANYDDWTPSTSNQAGSFRLPRGSRIVGGIQFPLTTLIWTNLDLWAMTYTGFPLVFSITQISSLCGLIAQNAVCVLGSTAYWMSDHGFFRFVLGGAAEQLKCAVWDTVFKDLDFDNQDKCIAGPNYNFSEIFWFYPSLSGGSGEIDSYVKYNLLEDLWDIGDLARTAWTDQNTAAGNLSDGQFGADLNGYVQQHEVGYDDDGAAMAGVRMRSGYLDMADGDSIVLAKRLIPDFLWSGDAPSITATFFFRNFPGDTPTSAGPFTITPDTDYLTLGTYLDTAMTIPVLGIRGREVALEIECASLGTWFRLGVPRLLWQPDGKL